MDFIDRARELAGMVKSRIGMLETEEATKHALVMPFIDRVLGYNVFDPTEVTPELTADVGIKKGEKVDYAILRDGKPIILFEGKHAGADLDRATPSQLFRYFSVTEARFGVVTDGVIYRFFTDLDQPNKMDAKPFFEFNLFDFDDTQAAELKKFSKPSFNMDEILATASELKYTKELKRILGDQLNSPSDDFVGFFASQVYTGKKTTKVLQQFRILTKSAFQQFLSDRISDRLKSALAQEQPAVAERAPEATASLENPENEGRTVTTPEELQGYYIIKSLLRDILDTKRVAIRDQKSYCSILLDDNNRKPLCRFYFGATKKQVGLFNELRKESRIYIEDIDDIFGYADQLKATVGYYATA